MKPVIPLDQIDVAQPCHENWNAMRPAGQSRFCAHCQKHVHDLASMTRDDAQRLICESAGSLCVRFARGVNNQVITLDYRPSFAARWRWRASQSRWSSAR